jgi:A/G-specific adenine glycosylase
VARAKHGAARSPEPLVPLTGAELRGLQRRLLAWFRRNQRSLPWRGTRDHYRIWISEVMLQQTRVAAALRYYKKFLARFPNVGALARARTESVLEAWAGLGYYSRARNLHRAAREILRRHGGRFPRKPAVARELPGVGRYTAAAVLSIAYGEPLAVLDGNVARVLARLGAVRGRLREPSQWNALEDTAQTILFTSAPGTWNQAMMELGATVCTPRAPSCGRCPVAHFCQALALDCVEQIPEKPKRRAPVRVQLAAAVLLDSKGRTLLVQPKDNPRGVLFSRMWQFPAVEVAEDAETELRRHLHETYGLATAGLIALRPARHAVTFRDITLLPYLLPVVELPRGLRQAVKGKQSDGVGTGAVASVPLAEVERWPTSSATRKIARAAGAGGQPALPFPV